MKNTNGNTFRPEEIVVMKHFDKKTGEWVETEYPKVGGRLRISHEQNESISITTEIVQYDGNVAVVKAHVTSDRGVFSGIGMASLERDAKIAPAILELAETRAIARGLRFSGVGVEYCSAEEVSHLDNGNPSPPAVEDDPFLRKEEKPIFCPPSFPSNGGNGGGSNSSNGVNGNGGSRLSPKQHSFLLKLGKENNISKTELNKMSLDRFAVSLDFLSKRDASSFIEELMAMAA